MRTSLLLRMQHLASRFCPGENIHVVDPQIDLRPLFFNIPILKQNIEARDLKIDVESTSKAYANWWDLYMHYISLKRNDNDRTAIADAKRDLKANHTGLTSALALPNALSESNFDRHCSFNRQGLMRIDRVTETVSLINHTAIMCRHLRCAFKEDAYSIRSMLINIFPTATRFSPPYIVRQAVLEGCNEDGDAPPTDMFIVGHSLSSHLAPFIRALFARHSNQWPMILHSAGMAYLERTGQTDLISSCQREVYAQVIFGSSAAECAAAFARTSATLLKFVGGELGLRVEVCELPANELKAYELEARAVEIEGVEVARLSNIGEYISRRLNLQTADGFISCSYAQVDIFRLLAKIVDSTIDGGKYPDCLKEAFTSKTR